MMPSRTSRRTFLKTSALFAGWSILPSGARANSPNSRFCTAHIGIGGMGGQDLRALGRHPMVQVCGMADVNRAAFNSDRVTPFASAEKFSDYREMLDTMGDRIDGVVISTPDHTHFPAARLALELGKPVYLQKPLTHEIAEAYELQKLAKKMNVATQMGIQCHSMDGYRIAVSFLQQGIIGKVSRVYVWSNKTWGHDGPPYEGEDPVPETLDWNLWLGTAPKRPYLDRKYHPGQWRKVLDFGCGTLGDMGIHIFDTPFTALKLGHPRSVKVTCREPNGFSHPTKNIIEYEFSGTEYTEPTLSMTWYDGEYGLFENAGDNPDLQLEEGQNLPKQGAMFIGENGRRLLLPHYAAPQPLPRSLLQEITKPDLPRADHYHEWVDAAMGTGSCSTDFDFAAPLTVATLVGVVGARFPGQALEWDGANMRFTNFEEANALLSRSYRTDY